MKPEIKQRWIEELRSGRYKQGRNQLQDGDRFCVLGVLCDIAAGEGVCERSTDGQFDGKVGTLPPSVRRWSGIEGSVGYLPAEAPHISLSSANDVGNKDFNAIANLIEKYL